MNFDLSITDITPINNREKMIKAVRYLSQYLGVPVSVEKRRHNHGPEPFLFKAQEELNYKWYNHFSVALKETYLFVINHFGLPEMNTVVKKASPDDPLTHKGKVLYSPETGQPIKKADWDHFVVLLEKFLNKRLKDTDKKIILDSKALGRVLDRMLKYNTLEAVRELSLDDVKYRGKTLDWISDSVKNMRTALGEELSRGEIARIQVLQMSAAEKITKASEAVKSDIRQILIDGVKCRKGKSQVSQAIFDRMTGANRDFQRIADTEIQNASNNSFLLDEVASAEPGEKVYFQRIERIDSNTCDFCKKMHGVVVLWSDHPLPDKDRIDDPIAKYAIWDGKDWDGKKEMVANGVFHPYCYDSETEVMTHRGWKLFKDLLDDDKIMSINPEDQEIDFVPFVKRVSYQYQGKMIHFLGRNYDLMVTPNHNMLYVSHKGYYHGIEAQKLIKKRDYQLPRAVGKWTAHDKVIVWFDDIVISPKQYFRLWAWYLAEGSGRERGKSCEVKLAQKDPQKIIKDLHELKPLLKPTGDAVYLYGKVAEPFELMFGIKAEEKYIPQFIKDSSKENIREFLDAFSLADGSKFVDRKAHKTAYSDKKNETVLRTSSPKMADDLCELIVKSGWMPSVYKLEQKGKLNHFANGDYILNTDCYNISICKSKFRHFGKDVQTGHKPNHNPVEIDYSGMVYDVELEKWHYLLVRRKGKCAWSGNCRGVWVRYNGAEVNALMAELQGKSKEFNAALEKTRQEYEDKGVKNPNDKTPGFTERVDELYGDGKIDKSLTFSGYKLQDKYRFAGFDISVENKKGSTRSGVDGDGHKWSCFMHYDYGYIRGTEGVDGDHVDVYIGDHEGAEYAYIVHQNNPVTGKYDEDKVMLGFLTLKEAKIAYLKQYDRPGFLGGIDIMPLEKFREKVLSKKNHGKMVKSVTDRVREALGGIQ